MYKQTVASLIVLAACQTGTTPPAGDPEDPAEVASIQQASSSPQHVIVDNTVPVTGTIAATQSGPWSVTASIDNFPAEQNVSGTVAVSNFPSTQPVTGNVTVSGTVSLASGTSVTAMSGDVTQQLYGGPVSGDITNPGFDVSAYRQVRVNGVVTCDPPYLAAITVYTTTTNGYPFSLADNVSTGQSEAVNSAFDVPGVLLYVQGQCLNGNQGSLMPKTFRIAVFGRR
jgi:hypothetical protein